MVHKLSIPASTRVELAQPRRFTANCMMGPMAIVPTPLPAVTIPFARPMRLKHKQIIVVKAWKVRSVS